MKENPNIDELLNSFLDGELGQRQVTEVQRLITHDTQIAKRLQELQRCKEMVNALPCAEAPAEMSDEVRAALEKRTLLGWRTEEYDEARGARYLLVRKFVAAAAMIGLVVILAAVVYTIVAPQRGAEKPIAIEDLHKPALKAVARKPQPVAASAEEAIAKAGLPAAGFAGRLEFKTDDVEAVDAFVSRAIEDNGLLEVVSPVVQDSRRVHTLRCSREGLKMLLTELKGIWDKFDSATLHVDTGQRGSAVVINGVNAEQVAQVVGQNNLTEGIKLARDFAVLNNMNKLLPGKEALAAVSGRKTDSISIPKPVLTSKEKTVKKPADVTDDSQKVRLTIVVTEKE